MRINFDEIFKKLEGKANAIYVNDESLTDLLNKVMKKVKENEQLNKFWDDIKLLIDLLRDWSRGDYKDVSKNTVIVVTVGLLYLINPFDIIPDFLPGGFIDDLVVVAYIIKKTSEELKKYKQWRGLEPEEQSSNPKVEIIIDSSNEEEDSNIIIIGGEDEED